MRPGCDGWGALIERTANMALFPLVLINTLLVGLGCALVLVTAFGVAVGVSRAMRTEPKALGATAAMVVHTFLTLFSGHCERVGGLTLSVRGERIDRGDERALVLCNHRSWVDTVVLVLLARHAGRLGGLKFVADSSLLKVPVVGVLAVLLDAVYVIERTARAAGAPLGRAYARLSRASRAGFPFWLILYPEGYLRSAAKLRAAREFAEKRGLAPLNHLLQPRTKGFVGALRSLRGDIDAVYDVTIAYGRRPYDAVTPSMFSIYFTYAFAPRVVHVYTRRIPMEAVPKDEDDAKAWLYKLYEEKDALLEEFYKNHRFPGNRVAWQNATIAHLFAHAVFSFVVLSIAGAASFMLLRQLGATARMSFRP